MQLVPAVEPQTDGTLRSRVYARIGLLGNPSDGYGGRVLSVSLANFWAEVSLAPATRIIFQLNPASDPLDFNSLEEFDNHITGHGYYGGVRLLMV